MKGYMLGISIYMIGQAILIWNIDFKLSDIYKDHQAEKECIATLIATGVERIDIKAEHGVCYVAKNAYYN